MRSLMCEFYVACTSPPTQADWPATTAINQKLVPIYKYSLGYGINMPIHNYRIPTEWVWSMMMAIIRSSWLIRKFEFGCNGYITNRNSHTPTHWDWPVAVIAVVRGSRASCGQRLTARSPALIHCNINKPTQGSTRKDSPFFMCIFYVQKRYYLASARFANNL